MGVGCLGCDGLIFRGLPWSGTLSSWFLFHKNRSDQGGVLRLTEKGPPPLIDPQLQRNRIGVPPSTTGTGRFCASSTRKSWSMPSAS
jgi:hypothetical protein